MTLPFSEYSQYVMSVILKEKQEALFNSRFKDIFMGSPQEIAEIKSRGIYQIEDVVLDDGMLRTKLKGDNHLLPIYAQTDQVNLMTCYKRLVMLQFKPLREGNMFEKVIAIISYKNNLKILEAWFEKLFSVYKIVLKEECWARPVREIRRALGIKGIWIDVISLVIEWDSAYRLRLQDTAIEINKNALRSNPLKELNRLADIVFSREIYMHNGMARFRKIKPIILAYLFLNRILLGKIKRFLLELDVEKLRMNNDELYWALDYKDYNFKGMSYQERQLLRAKL